MRSLLCPCPLPLSCALSSAPLLCVQGTETKASPSPRPPTAGGYNQRAYQDEEASAASTCVLETECSVP